MNPEEVFGITAYSSESETAHLHNRIAELQRHLSVRDAVIRSMDEELSDLKGYVARYESAPSSLGECICHLHIGGSVCARHYPPLVK
jgi:hypothetical protein